MSKRFSLRAILIVVVIISAYLAGWRTAAIQFERQIQEAEREVRFGFLRK